MGTVLVKFPSDLVDDSLLLEVLVEDNLPPAAVLLDEPSSALFADVRDGAVLLFPEVLLLDEPPSDSTEDTGPFADVREPPTVSTNDASLFEGFLEPVPFLGLRFVFGVAPRFKSAECFVFPEISAFRSLSFISSRCLVIASWYWRM